MTSFTLIYGCMFSGKTTKLIELYQHCGFEQEEIIVVKPVIDNRFVADKVNSHSGLNMPGMRIKNPEQIESYITESTKIIFIDEVQFFGSRVGTIIQNILMQDIAVVASGLDRDYLHKDFGPMPDLKRMADENIALTARCHLCDEKGTHTFRTIKNDSQILVGHDNMYQARCEKHWNEGMKAFTN